MALFILMLGLTNTLSGTLNGAQRPKKIFIVANRKGSQDILRIPLYGGMNTYFTKDSKSEGSLQCSKGKLLYTAGQKLYWQRVNKPLKENSLGSVPLGLASLYGGKLRRFIVPDPLGLKVLWPGDVALHVKSFDGTFSTKIFPASGRSIIHPASWRPGGTEILYLTHEKKSGRLLMHFRDVSKLKDRLVISPLGMGIKDAGAFEVHWSRDGQWVAVNLDGVPKKGGDRRRFFLVYELSTGKSLSLPSGYGIKKFHGFSLKNHLIVTAGWGKKKAAYRMGPLPGKSFKRIDSLGVEEVYGFYASRNNVLINQTWQCKKPRLSSISLYGTRTRLLRWARWTEIIAMDEYQTWAIFRGGGVCNTTRPNLYLMRVDGSLLLRELPKGRFSRLRHINPSNIAICN
ncbi:hypothetical protein KKF84_09845 [Myxococcota bacterium]|nr:hypothetical protein [Myxococcota bacterium]MBU1535613.1 hypothetical protein [Myxococcota bacterium]